MKRKRLYTVIQILFVVVLCGCLGGCRSVKKFVLEPKDRAIQRDAASEEVTSVADSGKVSILKFVDAYGKAYQMNIDPEVKPNSYDLEAFVHNGTHLSYGGDDYSYRLGIDVSHYQAEIDWGKVKASGIEFAMIRLGFRGYGEAGELKLDTRFEENIQGARRAGLDVGVYFFSQAVNEKEAVEEAKFVLEHLAEYDLQMPIAYDPETILHDEARTDDVTGEQFTKNTIAFCETIENAGYDAMVYCNMLWQAFELDMKQIEQYPIWYADYESKPQTPYHFDFWQYSSEGNVDGIQGNVDMNIQMMKK